MKDEHIIDRLEKGSVASLDEAELRSIQAHSNDCPDCRKAFEAAYITASLLKQRAGEIFEPPPFFETRVLAVLRERQSANEPWALGRMWRAAGALVSSMAVTVATLGVLSFLVPGNEPVIDSNTISAMNNYSAEQVILDQSAKSDEQISDEQVLTTLYEAEEDTVK